jgi:hypothetical protein
VGVGSALTVNHLLTWWQTADPSISFMSLTAAQIQSCNLASYNNLRVFIIPGGNGFNQLNGLGTSGVTNIVNFANRNQTNPSAIVSICAGAYEIAHDYIWESMYEGTAYFQSFSTPPPMSLFPHTVEGSLFDIGDDQVGTYDSGTATTGVFYRMINGSNSQTYLYFGGSSMGYNGVPDYSDPASPSYDPNVQVILYYQDFYGYYTKNLPAAWIYKNLLMTSIHAEADNSTCSDCVSSGTILPLTFLQNRAWLANYINQVAQTSYVIPMVSPAPNFTVTKPHASYPVLSCYGPNVLFCDSFNTTLGTVYSGLWQWTRNMTVYNQARPWNSSFTSTMLGNVNYYGHGVYGNTDGYAVCIPNTGTANPASVIISKPFSTTGYNTITFTLYYKGKTLTGGLFTISYTYDGGATWTNLFNSNLYGSNEKTSWTFLSYAFQINRTVQIKIACIAGSATSNYCSVDELMVTGA